jgi:DoxX-like family
MFVALIIATILLAAMAIGSAAKKLQKDEQVRAIIGDTVGVPERHFATLAALELAAAAGILLGLWLEPLGIAAAIGLILYFTGAVIAHLRVGDTKHLAMPLPPLALAIAVLVLRIVTL